MNGYGCCGGYAKDALKDVGSPTEECLPYNEKSSRLPWYVIWFAENLYKTNAPLSCPSECEDGSPFNLSKLYDYRCYKENNDHLIMQALERNHVVITSMRLDKQLKFYGCGIFCESSDRHTVNHAAVIVDYGTTDSEDKLKFWVVKNSWGPGWGESGYFRVRRGQGDLGIGTDFPICIPLLAPDPMLPPSNANFTNAQATCSPAPVENPKNDTTAMSAWEFGLQAAVDRGLVQCPDGANATNFTLVQFMDATLQSVEGTIVELGALVEVDGCQTAFCENIELTILIDFNGNFTLTSFTSSADTPVPSKLFLLMIVATTTCCLKLFMQ